MPHSFGSGKQMFVALEIVEGLGKAVVLIVSTVAVVGLGIVLAAMSSLP
jgi:hypothetical protein